MTAKQAKIREQEAGIKKFTTKVRVYWSDCDSASVVYFGNFFHFFEIAEQDLFQSLGRPQVKLYAELQIGLPRVEVWCRYRKPAYQGDLLTVTTWIAQRTEKSLLFQFETRRDGEEELVAEGNYWVVCVSDRDFRPIPLPQPVLDLLRDYLPPLNSRSNEIKKDR
ncbi:MAG: acyl-CoA thioesterase [Acidobacteria bacterium]|nr:acyl-CoA thioesterase [Acidobacteriota bacterium]